MRADCLLKTQQGVFGKHFMMSVCGLLFSCCLALGFKTLAQQSVSKADRQPYSLTLTTKLHSTGHAPYSGVYVNHHLNSEINLSWEYKQFGGFISKNVDFVDAHSSVNFSTVGIYRSFQLSKSVKLTPYLGCFLKQANSLIDQGSDMWVAVMAKVIINKWLFIENTSLVGNLLVNPTAASLANRLNVIASIGNFKLDLFAWYSHSFSNAPHFVSASLAITSPDWTITPSVSARVQIAMIQQMANERPEGAMHRGGLISLIVPIDLSPKKRNPTKN